MTDELVYDPKTKQLIKNKIYQHLYLPVRSHFDKRLHTIITKNSLMLGNGQEWVSYRGDSYAINEDAPAPRPMNRLRPEMKPAMDDYLKDLGKLNNTELPYVLGFINQVLNSSNSLQDYFKVLPESVHQPIRDMVAACACKHPKLTPEQVQELLSKNQLPIELMKQRMVLNLIT